MTGISKAESVAAVLFLSEIKASSATTLYFKPVSLRNIGTGHLPAAAGAILSISGTHANRVSGISAATGAKPVIESPVLVAEP